MWSFAILLSILMFSNAYYVFPWYNYQPYCRYHCTQLCYRKPEFIEFYNSYLLMKCTSHLECPNQHVCVYHPTFRFALCVSEASMIQKNVTIGQTPEATTQGLPQVDNVLSFKEKLNKSIPVESSGTIGYIKRLFDISSVTNKSIQVGPNGVITYTHKILPTPAQFETLGIENDGVIRANVIEGSGQGDSDDDIDF